MKRWPLEHGEAQILLSDDGSHIWLLLRNKKLIGIKAWGNLPRS